MITSREYSEQILRADLVRWRAEQTTLGPDPRWEPIRQKLQEFIDFVEGLLAPL